MNFDEQYRPAIAEFQRDAIKRFPREACGVITKDGEYIVLENVHKEPEGHFRLAAADYLKHQKNAAAIVHSHGGLRDCPSAEDMQSQLYCKIPFGITTVGYAGGFEASSGAMLLTSIGDIIATGFLSQEDERYLKAKEELISLPPFFWGDQLPIAPLLGRTFRHGVHDCYSIVRDWYRLERKITLPEFPRDDGWWHEKPLKVRLYEDGFGKAGFKTVDHLERGFQPQTGDVILYILDSNLDTPHHAGLYQASGLVLHHLPKHLSTEVPLAFKQKEINRWLRYIAQ